MLGRPHSELHSCIGGDSVDVARWINRVEGPSPIGIAILLGCFALRVVQWWMKTADASDRRRSFAALVWFATVVCGSGTDNAVEYEMTDSASVSDLRRSGLCHLGMPFLSVLLPLIVWSTARPESLPRRHARQAFAFQCVYLPFHIAATVLLVTGSVTPLLACMGMCLLFEVPQVVRGLSGREPFRLIPVDILRP